MNNETRIYTHTVYSKIPLLRPLLGMSESGLISGMVLILNIEYGKCSKISNTLFHTFFGQKFTFMQLFLKIPSGMANSIDPDQTAPSGAVWSGSALFAYALCQKPLCTKF